ncbi:fumarylacetoacetate hydrolase family protein [Listeria seeligeri]|uniref:fumarylacetoacetate hydrolase family protein n=1 Tax=Listeria seeligeri TaxID=1640 RepID=UPI001629B4C1|nr:fumarylacetoacetate hydrolase family protein [Listeria seeligeri]MBC1422050.1 fumarylacetoacetate hydrolase family protein [Listeria seeligeri]MBC1430358.1 fumarylacetoacetate hydrolase family protein [Listeria seeligeri]MBC1751511.1 fumarylacetoacetate hydrolase family protein [Listeria seeligeri]MBC1754769.1 fumarylacetoacetate hydrolase family protein [Listeria seeligeri]MBC1787879.1 fumarylacetoacetate hydrolase family protein [Listeria seeligeri]
MKWVSYIYKGKPNYGILSEENKIVPAQALFINPPKTLLDYIKEKPIIKDLNGAAETIPIEEVEIQIPFSPPNNIMAIGKNYYKHVLEMGTKEDVPEHILVFTKSSNSLLPHKGQIELHQNITSQLDYEGELAVIIGKETRDISEKEALSAIFGFTIINDITARDIQKRHKQFYLGKSLDASCPIGPCILTYDSKQDVTFRIETKVNGEIRQADSTGKFIFNLAAIISSLSKGHTLLPGDIIATGTPSGVGSGMTPPTFLQEGDTVKVTIDRIGTLENKVRQS